MISFDALRPAARAGALRFQAKFPAAVFTSGRRDLVSQAQAMAVDVNAALREGNPRWIAQVYVPSPASVALQKIVDDLTRPAEYFQAFLACLQQFGDEDLRHLSAHLSGDAWDIHPEDGPLEVPMIDELSRIVADHRAMGGEARLLLREGGLIRWHVQQFPIPEPEAPANAA